MKEKRLQKVVIPSEAIEDFFRGDRMIIEGVPDDADLVETWDEPARQTYNFVFESDEFPVVPQGEEIPEVDITSVQRRCNSTRYFICPNCQNTIENGDIKR